MPRRKLPIFTERTLAQTRADQIEQSHALQASVGQVSCKPGCSNCCSHAVHITIIEGILLYRALSHRGLLTASLRKRLAEHATRTWDLSHVVWHLSNIQCPLLEKDLCTVYDARPFVCRTAFSQVDPADCHPHRLGGGTSMVNRRESIARFMAAQTQLLQRHRVDLIQLPLSKAILYGEQIATGVIDLEDFLGLVLKDFSP